MKKILSTFAAIAPILVAAEAFAFAMPAPPIDCTTDEECGYGYYCGCGGATTLPEDPAGDAICALTCLPVDPIVIDLPTSECSTSADCPAGYSCDIVGSSGCDFSCPPGEACEPMVCDPVVFYGCVYAPTPCAADADCSDGFVCVSNSYEICSGRPAPIDPESGLPIDPTDPVEPACETITEAYCAPPYEAPCAVDADCGDGFTCREIEECACAGGSGDFAPPPLPGEEDPGQNIPVFPPDCECAGTGEFYCELQFIPCVEDAECPADFTCAVYTSPGTCYFDEATGEEICTDGGIVEGNCLPPGWLAGNGEPTPTDPTDPGEEVPVDIETPGDDTDPGTDLPGDEEVVVDVPGDRPVDTDPTPVDDTPNGNDTPYEVVTTSRSENGNAGCSATPATSGAGFLPLLALLGLVRRRR